MVAKRKVGDFRWLMAWTVAVMVVASAACSTPEGQQIRSIDSTGETVKMTYDEETPDGEVRRGVVECDVVENDLENCRRLPMEYR